MQVLSIEVQPLRMKLKMAVRHAAAARHEGENIWVRVRRNGNTGYGEGCPRPYVTGDDLETNVAWIRETFRPGQAAFGDLAELAAWVDRNEQAIDRFPAAWCAVEMALLDLLSREAGVTVEKLLGQEEDRMRGRYTAVLGDDEIWPYTALVDRYLIRGMADFKIKLSGNLKRDLAKIDAVEELSGQHRAGPVRIRLDANNLWAERRDEAIAYLRALGCGRIFAVEEPVGPRQAADIDSFSAATGLPVILDESLCTRRDLELFKTRPGKFIANIKISRLGGVIRALRMVEEAKRLGWPVIIGCHVGETSLLTRAALVAAAAAGENLTAQEGAFGDFLVVREPVAPLLKFGRHGLLDLQSPDDVLQAAGGTEVVPPGNWSVGFGMRGRMPSFPDTGEYGSHILAMPDGYRVHCRRWGAAAGEDVLLILHPGLGHSGWLAPLAERLLSFFPGMSVVAPDRRGCGLNDQRGDLGSVAAVTEDIGRQINFLKGSFRRVYLAGWGHGAQEATVAAADQEGLLAGLVLLTPGFFWNERFQAVTALAESITLRVLSRFKLQPERHFACLPVPLEAADFTRMDEWADFIENDPLKTVMITLKSHQIMEEIRELSWRAAPRIRLPMLVVTAAADRLTDNERIRQIMQPLLAGGRRGRMISMAGGHALPLERPAEVAREIMNSIRDSR